MSAIVSRNGKGLAASHSCMGSVTHIFGVLVLVSQNNRLIVSNMENKNVLDLMSEGLALSCSSATPACGTLEKSRQFQGSRL